MPQPHTRTRIHAHMARTGGEGGTARACAALSALAGGWSWRINQSSFMCSVVSGVHAPASLVQTAFKIAARPPPSPPFLRFPSRRHVPAGPPRGIPGSGRGSGRPTGAPPNAPEAAAGAGRRRSDARGRQRWGRGRGRGGCGAGAVCRRRRATAAAAAAAAAGWGRAGHAVVRRAGGRLGMCDAGHLPLDGAVRWGHDCLCCVALRMHCGACP